MKKVALVTGANSGIGKATTRGLAERGFAVAMACRNQKRGQAALDDIRTATGSSALKLLLADLAHPGAVRGLAEAFQERYDRLDVLVNNAGIYQSTRATAEYDGGVEKTFAVNHLAPFLLTNLLLPMLEQTAKAVGEARVVTLSSDAHRGARGLDLDAVRGEAEGYSEMQAYARSKLANVLFTYELARRLSGTGVTAMAVHPGVVSTGIFAGGGSLLSRAAHFFSFLYSSPERGAEGPLYLAAAPEAKGVTGQYFSKTKPARSSKTSHDEALAERLWQASEAMTGLASGRS